MAALFPKSKDLCVFGSGQFVNLKMFQSPIGWLEQSTTMPAMRVEWSFLERSLKETGLAGDLPCVL